MLMYSNITHTLICALAVAMVVPSGDLIALEEDIDYRSVPTPQNTEARDKIEVLELFSYTCPHCYHIESKLQDWLQRKPSYVVFRRMPAVLNDSWAVGAKIFYAAELLGVLEQVHIPLFKAIHEDHMSIDDTNKVVDLFASQGVKREDFLAALNSFGVDFKVRRAAQIGKELELDGVPSLLVDGRYLTGPGMTASMDKTFQVISELAAQEMQAKTRKAATAVTGQTAAVSQIPIVGQASVTTSQTPKPTANAAPIGTATSVKAIAVSPPPIR